MTINHPRVPPGKPAASNGGCNMGFLSVCDSRE
jgi:hypothetical protein